MLHELPLMPPKQRRSLGQYFTPPSVVEFALNAVGRLAKDDAVGASERRLIDPACGDGAFLRRALEKGLVADENAFGVDKDPGLREAWARHGLITPGGPWLGVDDGLVADSICGREITDARFDWVVGNPPYAGEGLKQASPELLARIAEDYELCRLRRGQLMARPEDIRKLPIEVLFVERFYRLCSPGGLIAIILPVGLFANDRWRFVREWLLARVTLHAVVSLPRATFRRSGITAKTCLAIARKQQPPPNHEVFLAEADKVGLADEADELPEILRLWSDGGEAEGDRAPWKL